MRITAETRYFAVEPILRRLDDERLKELRTASIVHILGEGGYMGLTLAQLAKILQGDISPLTQGQEQEKITVFAFYTVEQFTPFFEGYLQKLERLTPPTTSEEKAAAAACAKVETIEGLLYFAREYFALRSFAEAENTTLADLLLAKKDTYNKAIYQREYSRIMSRKK